MKQPVRDYRELQRIIVGLSDGIILLDADQKLLWANNAAIAMHGVGAVQELGSTANQYCKRFRLRYLNNRLVERDRYPIKRAAAGESFDTITVKVFSIRDPDQSWIHSVRSLALSEDAEASDCFVLIIKDETERFRAQERFETAFNANPAPAIICRVSDLRYVRVNPGFVEMTGYASKDILRAGFRQIDVLTDAEKRDLAIEWLKEGETIPQMEARVPLPDGSFKFVIVAGEPIEISEESCILFTFVDLDPRVKIESALRQSEQRFAKSFQFSPVPLVIFTLNGFKCVEANNAFEIMTGYAQQTVVGRNLANLRLWVDKNVQHYIARAIKETGGVPAVDLQLRTKDESVIDCLVSAEAVTINDEPCVLCAMQNITDRKRSETELIKAIEAVMTDTSWFAQTIVEKLAALRQSSRLQSFSADLEDLTDREREVLGLICEGQSNSEMSAVLKLSSNTIRNHVSSLYGKIGVKRRSAAVIWARERGITGKDSIIRKKPMRR